MSKVVQFVENQIGFEYFPTICPTYIFYISTPFVTGWLNLMEPKIIFKQAQVVDPTLIYAGPPSATLAQR